MLRKMGENGSATRKRQAIAIKGDLLAVRGSDGGWRDGGGRGRRDEAGDAEREAAVR